jgi:hypothetical protein
MQFLLRPMNFKLKVAGSNPAGSRGSGWLPGADGII